MMGVKGLREAFNEVVGPAGHNCTMALLDYDRKHDTEFQILRFRGTASDGSNFEVISDDLPPNTDMAEACRQTAQKFLDQLPGASVTTVAPTPASAEPSTDEQLATMSDADLAALSAKVDAELQARSTTTTAPQKASQ